MVRDNLTTNVNQKHKKGTDTRGVYTTGLQKVETHELQVSPNKNLTKVN